MDNLEKVNSVKEKIEKQIISHVGVSGIEITSLEKNGKISNDLCIRILVNDSKVSYHDLGIKEVEDGVPVVIKVRKITLQ